MAENSNPMVTITTTISKEYWDWCKSQKVGWNKALAHGVKYLMDGKDIEKQIHESLEKIQKLQTKVTEQGQRLWELENEAGKRN